MWQKFSDKEPPIGIRIAVFFRNIGKVKTCIYEGRLATYAAGEQPYFFELGSQFGSQMATYNHLWALLPTDPPTPPTPSLATSSSGEKQASNENQPNLLMIIKQGIEKDGR